MIKLNYIFPFQNNVWLGSLLQPMCIGEARPCSPLQHLFPVCAEDGPPLPVGQQLCLLPQLQVLHAVLGICSGVLLVHHVHMLALFYQVLEGKIYLLQICIQRHLVRKLSKSCRVPGNILYFFCKYVDIIIEIAQAQNKRVYPHKCLFFVEIEPATCCLVGEYSTHYAKSIFMNIYCYKIELTKM
jgi:hypothetical protein